MQIKIFTIPLFDNEEALEELNKFLRSNKAVDISKNLVQQGDLSYWSFCITYLVGAPPKVQQPNDRKEKVDYKQVLGNVEFARFALCQKIGQESYARTACFAAVAGTTTRGTAGCLTVTTTTTQTTGTTTLASASSFPSLRS